MRFIDFFDWNQSGWLDFQYYLASIENSTKHPALVGHRALLEITYAKVFAESTENPASVGPDNSCLG
jgi:hypothetical protein